MRKYGLGERSALDEVTAPGFTHRAMRGVTVPAIDLKVVAPLLWSVIHARGHKKIVSFRVWIISYTLYWDSPPLRYAFEALLGPDPGP